MLPWVTPDYTMLWQNHMDNNHRLGLLGNLNTLGHMGHGCVLPTMVQVSMAKGIIVVIKLAAFQLTVITVDVDVNQLHLPLAKLSWPRVYRPSGCP